MTTWFERRPGSEESLLALYDGVRAAEELDLAEQAHGEAFWAEIQVLCEWSADADEEADDSVDELDAVYAEDDDTERLPMSHAVGIVEHLLGGRPIRGGEQRAV